MRSAIIRNHKIVYFNRMGVIEVLEKKKQAERNIGMFALFPIGGIVFLISLVGLFKDIGSMGGELITIEAFIAGNQPSDIIQLTDFEIDFGDMKTMPRHIASHGEDLVIPLRAKSEKAGAQIKVLYLLQDKDEMQEYLARYKKNKTVSVVHCDQMAVSSGSVDVLFSLLDGCRNDPTINDEATFVEGAAISRSYLIVMLIGLGMIALGIFLVRKKYVTPS